MKIAARLLVVPAVACLLASSAALQAQVTTRPAQPTPVIRPVAPPPPKVADADKATHEQVREISVQGANAQMKLQTLCADADGRVLGLVAAPRGFTAPMKDATGEVHVITPDGKTVKKWTVKFHAHAINVGPDGTVFVAGDGKVAKFTKNSELLAETQLPHIADALKDTGDLKKAAEEQVKQRKLVYENASKQIKDRKEVIEKKNEADRTDLEKRQLQQYEQILKSYAQQLENITPESIINQTTARLRVINGIAVSPKDLFIVCGETKGYGFAVWRMSHDLKDAKEVLTGVRGCCGQMDVQVLGDDLMVAENTKHQFARYDRDGKTLGGWGKRGAGGSDGENFGGCCNPMNLCCRKGAIFTAESEGIVKKFSEKGEYVGLVGTVKITGGCKNVAIAVVDNGNRIYFCDQPGSKVLILEKKGASTKTGD